MGNRLVKLENKLNKVALLQSSDMLVSLERGGKGNVASHKKTYTPVEKKHLTTAISVVASR